VVQSQPGQRVHKTLSRKNPSPNRTDGVAQGCSPEFKPQYCKKKIFFKSLINENHWIRGQGICLLL
jgi:hypothetical protein